MATDFFSITACLYLTDPAESAENGCFERRKPDELKRGAVILLSGYAGVFATIGASIKFVACRKQQSCRSINK